MIQRISRALAWFSLALGAVQLIAPRRLLTAIGIPPSAPAVIVTRMVGLRELGVVPGLLTASLPAGWLAARAAGDVKDLALLAWARGREGTARGPVTLAMAAVAGVLALDAGTAFLARRAQRRRSRHAGRIVKSVTVNRPAADLYGFWRDLENLPAIMPHLERVTDRGAGLSHWVAKAPVGGSVEWDAEITEDAPNERIAWRAVEGSPVTHSGSVRFAPAPRDLGTEITVEMEVDVPGGLLGTAVAKVAGEDPEQQVADALRRFKQVMETGEPVWSAGTAHGRKIAQRPARPPASDEIDQTRIAAGAGARGGAS